MPGGLHFIALAARVDSDCHPFITWIYCVFVSSANCLSVGEEYVFIGCAEGIVRCFSPQTLQFITTLPRTHFLGVDVSKGLTISHMASHPSNAVYPDASAVSYDEQNARVSVVYNDHSLYIWDVRDIRKVRGEPDLVLSEMM